MTPGVPDERGGLIEGILQSTAPEPERGGGATSELLAFLIADIRGYTAFTQVRGDEAAAKLTAKFAMVVRELVAQFDGRVVELLGDEALCVFRSPRQALRLAVDLQRRCVQESLADPDLPLTVGIGVDAGEAVHGHDGYRGGALNLAARLCSRAGAGEVLASSEVTHLARRIDGLRYAVLDRAVVKGLHEPIRPVRVVPDGEDPQQQLKALVAARGAAPPPVRWLPGPLGRHPRRTLAAAVVAVLAGSALVAATLREDGVPGLEALGESSVGVVDPGDGHLVGQLQIGGGPSAIAAGFGSMWTADTGANTVSRIDPATLRVLHTIDVGAAPSALAVSRDSVWVANSGDGTVSRIDPTTNRPTRIAVGTSPGALAVSDDGSVWVANTADSTVSRVDPSRNVQADIVSVGDSPGGIAAGRDVWVADAASNDVTRIDARTNRAAEPIPVGNGPSGIALVGDEVWVASSVDDDVWRIATDTLAKRPAADVGAWPAQVAAVAGHLWIATQGDRAIVEVDPVSARRVRALPVGAVPRGIAGDDRGRLWVSTTIDPTRHHGGALRLVGTQVSSIDPAYLNDVTGSWLIGGSYDGLVGLRHAVGADGASLVPDLATAIPSPADRRTYTFLLRKGIRFSTGALVTVDDVRRGIERSIASLYNPLARMIVGAQGCTTERCSISGIATDRDAGTITITLVQPEGDFLSMLAIAPAAPAATPLAEQTTTPIPATGPYRVSAYVPGRRVVLTRNPHFEQWSAAAQPSGYPDMIEWRQVASDQDAAEAVESGRADWADARLAIAPDELGVRFGSRLHITPAATTHALSLNTRIWPFDNEKVRRALAYALDRGEIARAWPIRGTVACQVLPKNFVGYRPYCPFTLHRDDGTGAWSAPDIYRALRTMPGPPDRSRVVTIETPSVDVAAFQHVVTALQQLGFRAKLHVMNEGDDYYGYVMDTRNRVQAGFFGWVASGPSAKDFLGSYRCAAYQPASDDNLNTAGFCEPATEALMDEAERAQAVSPAAANDKWTAVDHHLVDAAPWIPLVTPSWEDAVSSRVHNYERHALLGPLFDQMWVD